MEGDARIALWVVALAIDYLGALVGRGAGWRLSPGHFAERHGLIVIIAIGESIVALGVGAAGTPLSTGVIVAALLGMTVAAALWWTYFDWVSIVAEQQLRQATGSQQTELARDAYSYLHFLMVAGIVLFATGLKKILDDYDDHLEAVPAAELCGGVALYLLAHVLLRLRITFLISPCVRFLSRIGRGRPIAMVALLAFWPFAGEFPPSRRSRSRRPSSSRSSPTRRSATGTPALGSGTASSRPSSSWRLPAQSESMTGNALRPSRQSAT